MHFGNDWLRDRLQRIHHVSTDFENVPGLVAIGPGHISKIVASRKDRTIGRDDDSIGIADSNLLERPSDFKHGFKR